MKSKVALFNPNQFLWRNLERVRISLEWSHSDIAERIDVSVADYLKAAQDASSIPLMKLFGFCRDLGIDFFRLSSEQIDLASLRQRILKKEFVLPERYKTAAFSRVRTSVHVLKYLEKKYSPEIVAQFYKRFQVSEELFQNLDANINLLFLTDLTTFLANQGVKEEDFFKMGLYSSQVNKDSVIGEMTRKCRSVKEAFRLHLEEISDKYDTNFHYSLKGLESSNCVIEVRQRKSVADEIGVKKIGSLLMSNIRAGIISGIPTYFGVSGATVRQTHSEYLGDSICRYEVDYEFSNRLLTKRRLDGSLAR